MERTQPDIVRTTPAQMHEIAHDLHNVGRVENALHCFSVDCLHLCSRLCKLVTIILAIKDIISR